MTENRHYPQRQINLPRHEAVRDPRPSSLAAAIARSRRASRAAILAMKRSGSSSSRAALTASSQRLAAETARSRRASRAAILASRRAVPQQTGRGLSNDPFLLVRSHYRNLRLRSQPAVQPSLPVIYLFGIQEFNSNIHVPDTYEFETVGLSQSGNYVCRHCDVGLWKEERRQGYNCCKDGTYAINPLLPVAPDLWEIFRSQEFPQQPTAI